MYRQDRATRTLPVSGPPGLLWYVTAMMSWKHPAMTRPLVKKTRRRPHLTTMKEFAMMAIMDAMLRTLDMANGSETLAMAKK